MLLGNLTIRFSGKCLRKEDAWQVFDEMQQTKLASRSWSLRYQCEKRPLVAVRPLHSPAESDAASFREALLPRGPHQNTKFAGCLVEGYKKQAQIEYQTSNVFSKVFSPQSCREQQIQKHSESFQILLMLL